MKTHYYFRLFILMTLSLVVYSCSSDDDPELSSEKDILKFEIPDIKTEINGEKIFIYVEASHQDLHFTPKITISPKAYLNANLDSPLDFTFEQKFSVIAEDKSEKIYTTEVVRNEGLEKVKLYFLRDGAISAYSYYGKIDHEASTITFDYDKDFYDTNDHQPILEITTLGNVTTTPQNKEYISRNLQEMKVVANGVEKTYKTIFRNTKCEIQNIVLSVSTSSYSLGPYWLYPEDNAGLNSQDKVIFALENEDVSNLVPVSLTLSVNASVSPSVTQARDFTTDVKYTVVSESGESQDVMIRVNKKKTIFSNALQRGLYQGLSSTYTSESYLAISKVAEAYIVDVETNEKQKCEITQNFATEAKDSYYMTMTMPVEDKKIYNLEVVLENGDVVDTTKKYSVDFNR